MSGYQKQGPSGGWIDNDQTRPLTASELNGLDQAVYDVKRRVFDVVKDYGAKGDGSTDDTAAIQAAQADALAAKAWVYFPYGASGNYSVTGLTVSPHEKWVGDGAQDVSITYHGTSGGTLLQPAVSTSVTDYVQLRDLRFNGNNLADVGIYMPSCAEWKVWNVEVSSANVAQVKLYGQRSATGSLNPADTTYNKFYNLRAIGGSAAGVLLTGTKARTGTTTTLSSSLTSNATTVSVADTSAFASSGQLLIDDEWVNYSGKTATTFTGCTRGYWNSTAAAHSSAATVGVAARLSGGTSNLNMFVMPRCSSQTGRGIWIDQGSANYIAQPVGNLTTLQGIYLGWYANTIMGGTVENCGSGGTYQIDIDETTSEAHDNWIVGVHNGGNPGGGSGYAPSFTQNTMFGYGGIVRLYNSLHGEINTDGTIARGTGFTCVRNGTGDYTITFTKAMTGTPVVTATCVLTAGFVEISTRTSSSVRVLTFDTSGTAADRQFGFAAKVPS